VLALLAEGARYFSDEYAVIDRRGKIHPFPRPISLRQGVESSRVTPVAQYGCFHGIRATAIISTYYSSRGEWEPSVASPGATVLEMMSNAIAARYHTNLILKCLTEVVKGTVCWRGARGEADIAARRIVAALRANDTAPSPEFDDQAPPSAGCGLDSSLEGP
jgi:hypothetical protein